MCLICHLRGVLGRGAADAPIKANIKLLPDQREILDDLGTYRRLVSKLNYLAITRSDIAFDVSIVSQFLLAPRTTHWDVVVRIFRT